MAAESRNWKIKELISAGFLEVGDGYRAKNNELGDSGLPFARAGNINGGFNFADADRFPIANLSRVGNKVSQFSDVVFTSKGTVGRFAFVEATTDRFVYSPQLCYWRSLSHAAIDPRFLYYWMQSSECLDQFSYLKSQTDMADYVSLRDQREMTILLPDTSLQTAIVSLLAPLDSRLDILQRTNELHEAIAQAIFKSWFVDFDPVQAKAEGREPEGMDADAAALFPSTFEDSELGHIPQGWTTGPITNVLSLNPTRGLKKKVTATYLDMASVPTSGPRATSWIKRDFVSGSKFINGDTLLARITPCLENGKTAYVDFLEQDEVGWGSTEFIVMATKPNVPSQFAYLLARDPEFRQYAIQSMSGTSGRQRVQVDQLAMFKIAIANDSIYRAFGTLVEPLFQRIKYSSEEQKTLADLRDTLLPRLISGKLRVPEAEAMLTAV